MTFAVCAHGQRGSVQELSPFHEALLDLAGAVPEILARPDGELFQIPAQLLRLDRSDGRDEAPELRAGDFALPRRGGLIDEPGASRGAADAVLLVKLQVGELEHELLQRLGLRLRCDGHVRREPFAQCDEDRVQRRVDSARGAADRDVKRLRRRRTLRVRRASCRRVRARKRGTCRCRAASARRARGAVPCRPISTATHAG